MGLGTRLASIANRPLTACAIGFIKDAVCICVLRSVSKHMCLLIGLCMQGFIQDFFLGGGEHLCAGKLISCSHRPQPPRGVWDHAPPEIF